jgi:hypothetical protein
MARTVQQSAQKKGAKRGRPPAAKKVNPEIPHMISFEIFLNDWSDLNSILQYWFYKVNFKILAANYQKFGW